MKNRFRQCLRSVTSVMLSVAMLVTGLPVPASAAEATPQDEAVVESSVKNEAVDVSGLDLEEELKNVVDENEYPNGVISVGETMLDVNEGNETTIRIVRGGNTDSKATVKFKAIDVSTVYGKDYTLSVKKGLLEDETLPANPDASPLMNEDSYVDNGDVTVSENAAGEEDLEYIEKAFELSAEADEKTAGDEEPVDDDAQPEEALQDSEEIVAGDEEIVSAGDEKIADVKDEDIDSAEFEEPIDEAVEENAGDEEEVVASEEPSEEPVEKEATDEEASEKEIPSNRSSLSNAYSAQMGKELQEYDWEEYDQDTIDPQVAERMAEGETQAVAQMKDVPGVETLLTFEKGEYLKEIKVSTIKDSLGESDEQFAFIIYDAEGSALGANYNGYVNIFDHDEKEDIVFEVKDKEITVSPDENKAVVTVVRTSGTEQMGFVTVGTSAGTAEAGEDYESVVKELFFAPSVTEQTVEIPINGSRNTPKYFHVGLTAQEGSKSVVKNGADATLVHIDPVIPAALYSAHESAEGVTVIPDGEGGAYVREDIDPAKQSEESVDGGSGKDVTTYVQRKSSYKGGDYHYWATIGDVSLVDYVQVNVQVSGYSWFFGDRKGKDVEVRLCYGPFSLPYFAYKKFYTDNYSWNGWITIPNNGFPKSDLTSVCARVYATGCNRNSNCDIWVKSVVKHYRDFSFYINNNTDYSKYTEKVYTSPKSYTEGNKIKLGDAKFSVGGQPKDIKSFGIDDVVRPDVTYSGKANSAGALSNPQTVNLAGYYLVNAAGDKSDLLPVYFKMDQAFLEKYMGDFRSSSGSYDFELVPVFEPNNATVNFKNEESEKGGYRGFKAGDQLKITAMDSVKAEAYQNTGYSIKKMEMEQLESGNVFDNTKAPKITGYHIGFPKGGGYTVRIYYDDTVLKVMADPMGYEESLKMGKVIYVDENEKVYTGDYKNPLKIYGVQRYKSYSITGVTDGDSGYRPVWRDGTVDNDEDGKWTDDKSVYSGFDVSRGNVISYPMQLATGRVYYNFEKRTKAAKPGDIEGVVQLIDRPIMYQDDLKLTETRGLNGAQVVCDGVTGYTGYGTLDNGLTKDGVFKLSSENYSIYDHYLVNVVYDGPEGVINTGAPFVPNISRELNVDATKELNFSNVRIYQEVTEGKTLTQDGEKTWKELNTAVHDKEGNFNDLSCATPTTKAQGYANTKKKYLISMDVTKDGFKIVSGEMNFYDRNGNRAGDTIKAKAKSDGIGFNFEFKPNEVNIEPGYSVRVKFTDNQGHTYLERRLGIIFSQELEMFSVSNEFLGGKAGVVDMIGNVASAIDLGWSGKYDTQGSIISNEDGDKVISCGFNVNAMTKESSKDSELMQKAKEYVKEQEKVGKLTKEKNAAQKALDDATDPQKKKKLQEKYDKAVDDLLKAGRKRDVAKDEFDEEADKVGNGDKDKKSYSVGYKLKFDIGFKLTIILGLEKDTKSEHYREYYFKSMTICAILSGEAGADVKFALPLGISVNIGIKLAGSGTFAFIIQERQDGEDNEEIRKKYRHYLASGDQTMAIWDISGEDRANDAMGAITLNPSITLTVGVGWLLDMIEGSVEGKASFNMNFYINSSQSNDGTVTLSAKVVAKVIKIFKFEKTIASKKFQLYGSSMADEAEKKRKKQEAIDGASDEEITGFNEAMDSFKAQDWLDDGADAFSTVDNSFMADGTEWNVGKAAERRLNKAEKALGEADVTESLDDDETGNYVETKIADKIAESPDFDMVDLGEGKYAAVFTNVPADRVDDGKNATAAYYTVYNNGWKQPKLLGDDGSLDCNPKIFSLGKDRGAIITWSTVSSKYKDTDSINKRQMALDLNGRFMDKNGNLVGDIIEITKTTEDVAAVSDNTLKDYSDFASDVAACVSYNEEGLIVYYNKREYDLDAEEVGDVFFPKYSANAARRYTFGAGENWYEGKWTVSTNGVNLAYMMDKYGDETVAKERLDSYNNCFYGQLFYDCLPEVTVNEQLDEFGWWKDGSEVTVTDNEAAENPPLIIDCDAISYNDLGLFAYTVDRDGNMKTYNDRDVYLQIFDFVDGMFVYPICVTSAADSAEDSNVKFTRTSKGTSLSWLSDGDIKMLDVTRLLKNYSKDGGLLIHGKTEKNNDYYYINKRRPNWISIVDGLPKADEGADGATGYLPPQIMVYGEKTEDTEAGGEGKKAEDGASSISSFDAVCDENYIYYMWSQSGLSQIEETETDEYGDYTVKDEVTEDQLYVARYDAVNTELSRPVQVTSTPGAHYFDPAMVIDDEGGLVGLAYKAPTRKITAEEFNESIESANETSDWSERQQTVDEATFEPFDIVDTKNASAVAFKVLPEGRVKIKNAKFTDTPAAGKTTGFNFEILNDSVSCRDNLLICAYDKDGNDLLRNITVTGEPGSPAEPVEDDEEILIEGLEATDEVAEYLETGHVDGGAKFEFGGTFIPDVDDPNATIFISVYSADGKELLAYEEVTADFEEDCEITDLAVENTGERNEYRISGKVYNGGTKLSVRHSLEVGLAKENGDVAMTTVNVDRIRPFEEEEFETTIRLNDSDFTAVTDKYGNLEESFAAYAVIKGNKNSRTEVDGVRTAYADQMRNINALTDVKLGENNVVAVTVSSCAVVAPEYISSLASEAAGSDGGMGLKFAFEEQSGDVFDITKDGVINAHKEGSGEIVLHVYPSDRQFEGDTTSESLSGVLGSNVDGYAEMPAGAIFTKRFTVACANAGETIVTTDKKGVGYAVVSETEAMVTGLSAEAAAKKTKISIPKKIKIAGKKYNVVGIAPDAFKGNTLIKKVVIGRNVTTIGAGAFSGCTALKTVKFGRKVQSIGAGAFMGDIALKKISLPKSLIYIEVSAFEGCSLVKKLVIPKNVQSIGNRAFALCTAMKKVTVKSSVLGRVGIDAFTGVSPNAVFKIKSKSDYREKVAAQFSTAAGIVETMVIKK